MRQAIAMEGNDPHARSIGAALVETLRRVRPDTTRIVRLRRLTGGASLETWAFDRVAADGDEALILRRRGGSADALEMSIALSAEAALLRAAERAAVPVASVVHVCTSEDGLGDGYVMTRVPGETLGRRIARDDAFASARAVLGRQCGAALARIHRMPVSVGLETMDAAAVLARYEDIWRQGEAVRPTIEAAFRWLAREVPSPVPVTLVHGDFRNGNLVVDPVRGLTAVLDWELAHLGDPAEDLGWLCVNSWRFGQTMRPVGGFASLDDLLSGYEAGGGIAPPVARIRYWQAVGTLKWAVMTGMMYRSYAEGPGGSVERAVIGRRLSECEVDLLALMDDGR